MSDTNSGSGSGNQSGGNQQGDGGNVNPPTTDVGGIQKRDIDPARISKKDGSGSEGK